jgi:hypothetical protein
MAGVCWVVVLLVGIDDDGKGPADVVVLFEAAHLPITTFRTKPGAGRAS